MKINLEELIKAGILEKSTADQIKDYYEKKQAPSGVISLSNIIPMIGLVFVGLGILLVIGYNWDQFPKWVKMMLGLLPLVISQGLGAYTLTQKRDAKNWNEITAAAILFGVGIAMAAIANVYQLSGTPAEFMRWWIILSLPLIYLFEAGFSSLLIWIGVGTYITSASFLNNTYQSLTSSLFILLALCPYIYRLLSNKISIVWAWHHVAIPVVLVLYTFTMANAYSCHKMAMVLLLLLLFVLHSVKDIRQIASSLWLNVLTIAGFTGTTILAYIFSFRDYWTYGNNTRISNCFGTASIVLLAVYALPVILILYYLFKNNYAWKPTSLKWEIMLFIILSFTGHLYPDLSRTLVNAVILASSAYFVYQGVQNGNLWNLNLGLVLLAILIICRFFGSDIPIVWRGIIFILLGLACFSLNYMMIKRKKV